MPVEYEIDSARNVVVTRYSGDVSEEMFQEYFERLESDPRFRRDMNNLVVATAVRSTTVQSDSIRTSVGRGGWEPKKRAIVLPSDKPAIYGMARMSSAYWEMKGSDVKIFDSEQEARAWLAEPSVESGP
jgi:hypothetical protein